jgi:N-methylhydantoinase A
MGLPLFDHEIAYPEPYVPRALTFEVPERLDADGTVVRPLDETAVVEILETNAAWAI